MNYEKIGEFIAKKRKEKNLTQKDLASSLGVTDKAVSKWERGLGCPDVSILEVLADKLDVSILEILKGRIIENEIIPITEANDYILDTVKYSNKTIKDKNKKLILNILTFIIIIICSFLFILNIYHIIYLNKTETYNFSDNEIIEKIKIDISEIENNTNIIKSKNTIFTDEEYKNIIDGLNNFIENYKKMKFLNYTGIKKFTIKDLYILDLDLPPIMGIAIGYKILGNYDGSYNDYRDLYMALFAAKGTTSSTFYSEPDLSYQYKLIYFFQDNFVDNVYSEQLQPRFYDILYRTKELLYYTKNVMKVGGYNE